MQGALTSLLLADSGIAAVLSNRINWGRAPQKVLAKPYAVMQKISGLPDYHMRAPSGLVTSRIQFDVYSNTYETARSAADALIKLLSGFTGTVSGTKFQGVFLDGDRDLTAGDAGDVNILFRISLDFIFWHN